MLSSFTLGYDKNGQAIDALFGFGFGLVEIGSVTPEMQEGNKKPRMFRLPEDKAVINRYGFNSDGHQAVIDRLKRRIERLVPAETAAAPNNKSMIPGRMLGINLGKNKTSASDDDRDYLDGIKNLGDYADYLVINISSPNTPGLRSLQRREPIQRLLKSAKAARDTISHKPPLLVKISPDLSRSELEDIAQVCKSLEIDGVIISNTTISRPSGLKNDTVKDEAGGLSGAPVLPLALEMTSNFYKLTDGKIPIIGCGGISSGEDAIAFCKAGASAVQIYTSFGYKGPGIVWGIKDRVAEILEKEGKSWNDLVGSQHTRKSSGWLW